MVTGAASGIGREVALALAEASANLVAVDRDQRGLERAAMQIGEERAAFLALDLCEAGVEGAIVEGAVRSFGRVDVLVNCADIFPSTLALDLSLAEWDEVMGVNLRAPFVCSQAVARAMVADGRGGSIINVASTAGAIARPGVAHYCASKAALIMLTRVLAIEWADAGIRVNAVAPGVVETEGVEALLAAEPARREHEAKLGKIPLARLARPREIAEAVLFLAEDRSSYMTGQTMFVDGGYSAGHTFRD